MLELAQNLDPVPALPEQFDTNPWLLNCTNGTLDLRADRLERHQRSDFITKMVPFAYDSKAACPLWCKFLDTVFAGNKSIIEFVQRFAGYSLTGVVSEHCMGILYGDGRNGKSTFVETLRHVLNDYAVESAPGLLVEQRNATHPTEIADLHGARFASNSEVGQGQKLDEAKFKRLTGGDRLKARRMYQDFWEFYPTHKFWMSTNHKPVIRETKEAIWRRIYLIPFVVVIPESQVDKKLGEKLRAEAEGILAWMVRGCLQWQSNGLIPPAEVVQPTAKAPGPTHQALTPPVPTVDPEAKEEKEAREAAEQMLADWRAGNKSPNLMAMDLVDKGILLDYKIVSFNGRTGTVNLSLQTEDGPPAQKQYRMLVGREGGKWQVFLGHR